MSQFSRRARWLDILFPQSVAPRTADPGRLSDDVSLVQPYDGGGFGLGAADDPDWWHFVISATQASDDFVVFTVETGFIFRWMLADASVIAGGAVAGRFVIQAQAVPGGGSGVIDVQTRDSVSASGLAVVNTQVPPIVGPFSEIRYVYDSGDAATRVLARIYGVLAPIGTNFNV